MNSQTELLATRLRDSRGKRVIFVSHCILNENTRYLGGAFAAGALTSILPNILESGIGIIQMKCPEQVAWGGIHKKYMWLSLKSESVFLQMLKSVLFPLFLMYTRFRYRRLARSVAQEISDYVNSGYEVVGILGVDGSPSCGVHSTLDLGKSFHYFNSISPHSIERRKMNDALYSYCLRSGQGIFVTELKRALHILGIHPKFHAHDIVAEMEGKPILALRPEVGDADSL